MTMVWRLRSGLPLLSKVLQLEFTEQKSFIQRPLLYLSSAVFSKFSRSYATPSEVKPRKAKKLQVPLQLHGLLGDFATALFKLAASEDMLEKVESELLEFNEASKQSAYYPHFVKDLSLTQKTRIEIMNQICEKTKLTRLSSVFMALLAEKGKLDCLGEILLRFQKITRAHRGEVVAVVTSAAPLSPEEHKDAVTSLEELNPGKKILMENKIDPSILGGMVLEFDDKMIDISVKSRMAEMWRALGQAFEEYETNRDGFEKFFSENQQRAFNL